MAETTAIAINTRVAVMMSIHTVQHEPHSAS